jgi:hypothetical protein
MNETFFSRSGASPPSAAEIRERIRLIRRHPIQDLILATIEHSTPVIYFARSTMPIAEAIALANDPKNFRASHTTCNSAKGGRMTREEWFARGLNEREAPRLMTEGQLLEFQFRVGASGRAQVALCVGMFDPKNKGKGCRVGGRVAKEKRLGFFAIPPDQHSINSIKGGKAGSHTNRQNKTGMFAPGFLEKRRIGGRTRGYDSLKNHTAIFGRTPEQHTIDSAAGGRASQLALFIKSVAWG